MAKGVDVDAVDEEGDTALYYAIKVLREECACYLLAEAGASWSRDVVEGTWPLSMLAFAAGRDCYRIVKGIVQRMRKDGVGAGEISEAMGAAAAYAIKSGKMLPLKALIEEGLDVTSARTDFHDDVWGSTTVGLLHHAASEGRQEVVEFLIEQGCDPFARSDRVWALLPHHAAAVYGRTSLLKWLMERHPVPIDVASLTGATCL